jgi:hypothetical protein
MNEAGRKKNKLWDGVIEYEEPAPDAIVDAIKASIDAHLDAFERHKEDLLAVLRMAYERSPKTQPFDSNQSWQRLTTVASFYFWRDRVKQARMSNAARIKGLHEIAKALNYARTLIREAMPNEVGNDLRWAWWQGTSEYAKAKGRFVDFLYIEGCFEKVAISLVALETAAARAAVDVPARVGRPKATGILPRGDIEGLATAYRDSTGLKPGAGRGPFARFVLVFLAALGRTNVQDESVIDAIKDARQWALKRAAATRWGPSPFNEEYNEAD